MSSITLITFEMLWEDVLMSFMASIILCICSLPFFASSPTSWISLLPVVACVAFSLVSFAISFMEAVICSIALACCVDPCASAWLAPATCSAPAESWKLDSLMPVNTLLLFSTSSFKARPSSSSTECGSTSTVKSPLAIFCASIAFSLVFLKQNNKKYCMETCKV